MTPRNTDIKYHIRTHRPGDMETIVSRHGSLYTQEFGWDRTFETEAARVGADLIENYDSSLERIFIGESVSVPVSASSVCGGMTEFLGSIVVAKHRTKPRTAQIRLFLVDPAARGMGLGASLIDECVRFARSCNNSSRPDTITTTTSNSNNSSSSISDEDDWVVDDGMCCYERIMLSTFSVLEAARRLYSRAGFKVVDTGDEVEVWGSRLTPEVWELSLLD